VFICTGCGIGEAVKIDALSGIVTKEQKITHVKTHDAFCSEEGVALIKADVAAGVTHPVVAACSHRVMTDRFQFAGAEVVRANLREQVAWSQAPMTEDTQMLAADQIRIGIAQARKLDAPKPAALAETATAILVVGGGVTGLSAALEAARAGHAVILVERSDRLGGWAAQWSGRLPSRPPYREPQKNDIGALIEKVAATKSIAVHTNSIVARTAGGPGRFSVTLSKAGAEQVVMAGAIVLATGWRPYDTTKLGHLGYGGSPHVVTGVELESLFKDGRLMRKSDGRQVRRIAFLQCAGSRDPDHLPYCSSVCCSVSIRQAMQVLKADPKASAYIVYEELRTPGTAEELYREAQRTGVIFMKGKVKGVAARDMTVTYADELLGEEVPLAGLDMIVLATGMVPNSTNIDGKSEEKGAELLLSDINPTAPLKVAGHKNGGGQPWPRRKEEAPKGAPLLNLQYRQGPHVPVLADGFADSHYLCFPYETRRTGIYTAGPLRRPMDMAESAEDAGGAVLKAIQAIKGAAAGASTLPRTGDLSFPKVGLSRCTKCRRCTVECPFGAIDEDEKGQPIINESRCRRCGTCMGACPVQTITFDNYNPIMVSDMIKAVQVPDEFAKKPRVLILACENDAYPALDMAGIQRKTWSTYVRTIPVRCLGSVTMLWPKTAFEKGYDGVLMLGCKSGDDYQCHFIKGSHVGKERMAKFGETLKSMAMEKERVALEEIAIADSHHIGEVIDRFAAAITKLPPNPFKGF
jgi:quinone-modifying oxidoreductase subunit QmoB